MAQGGLANAPTLPTGGDIANPGTCQCGCGRPTRLAERTQSSAGHVKGLPLTYIKGHSGGCDPPLSEGARAYLRAFEAWLLEPNDKSLARRQVALWELLNG